MAVRFTFLMIVLSLCFACNDSETRFLIDGDSVDGDQIDGDLDQERENAPADEDTKVSDGDPDADAPTDGDADMELEAEIGTELERVDWDEGEQLELMPITSDQPLGYDARVCTGRPGRMTGYQMTLKACDPLGTWKYEYAVGIDTGFGSCMYWPGSSCYFRLPRNEQGEIVSGYLGCREENDLYFDRLEMTIDSYALVELSLDTTCDWSSTDGDVDGEQEGDVECVDNEDCQPGYHCSQIHANVCIEDCVQAGCEAGMACIPMAAYNECYECTLDCPADATCRFSVLGLETPGSEPWDCIYACPSDCPNEQCNPLNGTCVPACERSCDEGQVCRFYRDDYYCLPPFDANRPIEWVDLNTGKCLTD